MFSSCQNEFWCIFHPNYYDLIFYWREDKLIKSQMQFIYHPVLRNRPERGSKQQQVSVLLQGRSLDLMSVCECVWEPERERERERLAAGVNLFDQSLHLIPVYFQESHGHFSRTLSPLCVAKAFPPPPLRLCTRACVRPRSAAAERLQHFSDISRLLTFTVKSPQTCLSSNLQRADTQVNELHTYNELCQCCGAGSKRLQTHSSEELCIIILVNLANGARGRVCSLCMHVLSIETYRDICCSCLKSRFLPKPVRPAKTAFNTLYFTFNRNNTFTTNSHRFFRFSCEVEFIFKAELLIIKTSPNSTCSSCVVHEDKRLRNHHGTNT